MLCSDLVAAHMSAPGSAPREVGVILEEIAAHSACLQTEEAIPVETTVRLLGTESAEGGLLMGTVVHCRHHADLGYFCELRFVPGCTWSPLHYRPLHLFDPRELQQSQETASQA